MQSRPRIAAFLIVSVFCFVAGLLSVWLQGDAERCVPTPSPTATSRPAAPAGWAVPSGKISILVMGVDEIQRAEPQLLAVWFLSFEPPGRELHLLGIPVDAPLDEKGTPIRDAFSLWEPPDYGASFIAALANYAPGPIQGFAVLDEEGFAALIDYMGGIELGDEKLDGAAAVGALGLLQGEALSALKLQARLLEALAARAPALGRTPEITPLTALIPDHAYSSPSPYQLASLGSQLLPLDAEAIDVEILTDPRWP